MKNPLPSYLPVLFAYCAIVAALLYQVLFFGMVPSSPDTTGPLATSIALDSLRESSGKYPLWQPWLFSGMPTVEAFTYLNGLYYPGIVLKFIHIEGLHLQLLHLLFAAIGGYVLLRSFRLSHLPAFLGGAAFMLNPYLITMFVYGHGSQLMTAAYMPWMIWAGLRVLDRATFIDIALLALFAGFQLQRAHVQIAYYSWMLLFLLMAVAVVVRHSSLRETTGKLARAGLSLLIAVALAAAVYMPALAYSPFSVRGVSGAGGAAYEYATMWSMHPTELLTFLLPGFFGFGGIAYWGHMPFTDFPNYAGLIILLLACFGAWARRHEPFIWFLVGSIALSILVSFGAFWSPLYDLFYHFAPFFNRFRVPSMILIVLSLNLSLLAGFGLQAIRDGIRTEGVMVLKGGSLVLALLILALLVFEPSIESFFRGVFPLPAVEGLQLARLVEDVRWEQLKGSLQGFILFSALFCALLWLHVRRVFSGSMTLLFITALALCDIILVDRQIIDPSRDTLRRSQLLPAAALEHVFRDDDVTDFLKHEPGIFRIYPAGSLFGENRFAAAGLESVGGYHPAKIARYDALLRQTGNLADIGVLRMLNVRYVISPSPVDHPELEPVYEGVLRIVRGPQDVRVYRLRGARERAWFASGAVSSHSAVGSPGRMMQETTDSSATVFVEDSGWQGERSFAQGKVLELDVRPERIMMRVLAEGDAFLVLSEVFYPRGWKALLDGSPVRVYPVNGVVRGVRVPAGEHRIVFSYDRTLFNNGRAYSLGAAVLIVGLFAGGAVTRRRDS